MANRYWVGGTDNWNGTAGSKWATTSGGAGGAAEPTASDDVFFDGASGAVTVTVATSTRPCRSLNFTGFTGTFAGSTALSISGSLTMGAGMTRTYTGGITFNATTAGWTITSNGISFGSGIVFNCSSGSSGTWALQDNLITTGSITITSGSFSMNGFNISATALIANGSVAKVFTASGNMTLSTANAINFSSVSNLTFTDTGSHTLTNNSANILTGGNTWTFNQLTFSGFTGTCTIDGPINVKILTILGGATKSASFNFGGNVTVSGTGSSLSIDGNSITNRLLVTSNTLGTARTITAATISSLTNLDIRDITGAGAGSWTGTSLANALGNSGITFTTPVTRYWVKGAAAGSWSDTSCWSASSGGASGASFPICHDTVIFDASSVSGTRTITFDMSRLCADLTMTNCSGTPNISVFNAGAIFGSFAMAAAGSILSNTIAFSFAGRSSHTWDLNGRSIGCPINIDMFGGTLQLASHIAILTRTLTLNNGTLDANNKNLTLGAFVFTSTAARTLTMGSGTWTIGNQLLSGTIWNGASTGLTLNANTSTIKILTSASNTNVFIGGGLTYYNIWFAAGGAAVTLQINSSNTFNDIDIDPGITVNVTAGTTQTFANWSASGTAGNLFTLNSTTTGVFNMVKSGGGVISFDYANIQHMVATPANTWYAGTHSTDNQGVATAGSGVIFSDPPTSFGNFFLLL